MINIGESLYKLFDINNIGFVNVQVYVATDSVIMKVFCVDSYDSEKKKCHYKCFFKSVSRNIIIFCRPNLTYFMNIPILTFFLFTFTYFCIAMTHHNLNEYTSH